MEKRFTLTKTERLCLKKDIENLFSNGRWLRSENIRVVYLEPDYDISPNCQVMFTVPKKKFKRAVKRNLLKRRMREAYRINKYSLTDLLEQENKFVQLCFVYSNEVIVEYQILEKEIKSLLLQTASRVVKRSF